MKLKTILAVFGFCILSITSNVVAAPIGQVTVSSTDFSSGSLNPGTTTTYDYRADENFYNTADNQYTIGTNPLWNNEWTLPNFSHNTFLFNGNEDNNEGALLQLNDFFVSAGDKFSGSISAMSMCKFCRAYSTTDSAPVLLAYFSVNGNSLFLGEFSLTDLMTSYDFGFESIFSGVGHLTIKNKNNVSYTNDGAVSSVLLNGPATPPVPEPASLLLTGTALAVLGRRLKGKVVKTPR